MQTVDTNAVFLQAMNVFNEAVTKLHQIGFDNGVRLLTTEETSQRLGNMKQEEVKKLYKNGTLKGLRKGNGTIVIFSDSIDSYILSLKKITDSQYFTNEQQQKIVKN